MVYTLKEYSKVFPFAGKYVSIWTIKRRCLKGMLPENHVPRKIGAGKGTWIIEVKN